MFKPRFVALAAALLAAPVVQSQELRIEVPRALDLMLAQVHPMPIAPQPPGEELFEFAHRGLGGEAVVKGAPYCATAVHESVQPLLDGNRIVRRHTSQLCRDGEGRTRHEVQRDGGSKRVYLRDPVARETWVLDPERKSARRFAMTVEVGQATRGAELAAAQAERHRDLAERQRDLAELRREAADRWREQSERWRDWAQEVAKRARDTSARDTSTSDTRVRIARPAASGAEPGVVVDTETSVRSDGRPEERRREVRVIRLNDLPAMPPLAPLAPLPPTPPLPPLPALALLAAAPGFSFSLGSMEPRGAAVNTALAPKEIEGVKVNGERSTWTIEAGKLGNEKPIVITREVWRSPELMLVLHSRDADPRSGEVNYRLEKIKRGEPDAALMKVPADFQQSGRKAPTAKS